MRNSNLLIALAIGLIFPCSAQASEEDWIRYSLGAKRAMSAANYTAAEELLKKADKEADGITNNSSHKAITLGNLSLVYKAKGDYPSAEICARQSVDLMRKLEKRDDFSFAVALSNLAGILKDQAKFNDAEP
ncbi:MAG: hypothetical protein C0507_08805, partial [Cyanobacteria bacterium PR.3.49]|nr:hypothetical protein [Cyanobacteria bacterium PR.3.49]